MRPLRKTVLFGKVTLLLSLSVLTAVAPDSARAQRSRSLPPDPVVSLNEKEARAFDGALKALTKQGRVAFVAEGEPLKTVLSDGEAKDLSSKGSPLGEMARRVASAYDYALKREGSVFLLSKRYSDPEDLPGVMPEEYELALQDMLRVLSPFSPGVALGFWKDPRIKELVASFTEEQVRALADKQTGLPIAAVTPRQRELLWLYALKCHIQLPEREAQQNLGLLRRVTGKETRLGWASERGQRWFGYEVPNGEKRAFLRLGNPDSPLPGDDTRTRTAAPSSPDARSEGTPSASTLGGIVSDLNARAGGGVRMVVDDALAPKPVTVVGGEAATPARILAAMADVYGLRVKEEKDGTLRLTRRLWKTAAGVTAVNEALRRVFPEPFLRALHLDAVDEIKAEQREMDRLEAEMRAAKGAGTEGKAPPTAAQQEVWARQSEQRFKKQQEHSKWLGQRGSNVYVLRRAALRRLASGLDPKLRAAPDERVPLEALGAPERMALATWVMTNAEPITNLLIRWTPEFIERFDQIILTGGVFVNPNDPERKRRLSLFLKHRAPQGYITGYGPGFTGVEYGR